MAVQLGDFARTGERQIDFMDLVGERVLVVEDDYLQASNVTLALDQGSDVIGPFPDLESSLVNLEATNTDVAVLDIHLGSDLVYPVADRLEQARGTVPICCSRQ